MALENTSGENGNAEQSSRRKFLKASGAAIVSTALGAGAPAQAASRSNTNDSPAPTAAPQELPQGYNILFILVDQERYFDHWPFPVPGREALKRRGITFTNHQIASCVCSPSRSTIYTGLHIQHTGIFDNAGAPWQPDLSPEIRTVGHMFRDIGYYPAYLGKWHLSATMRQSSSPYASPVTQYNQTMKAYGFEDYFGIGDLIGGAHGGYNYDGVTTASAVAWLRTRAMQLKSEGKPWFLAVNLVNPHDAMWINADPSAHQAGLLPTMPPPKDRLYQASWQHVPLPDSRVQPLDAPGRPTAHAMYGAAHDNLLGHFPFTDAAVRIYQDNYFNCIRDCDQHIERLMAELKNLNLSDKTIVVMTSDHGDLAGYHHMIDKGANTYRQQNHVPLIICHPAYPGGQECDSLTSHIDIAPTLLGLAGIDPNRISNVAGRHVKGRSFAHLLSAPSRFDVAAVRPATLFNYAMLLYYDSEWMLAEFRTLREKGVPIDEIHRRVRALQPNLNFRGAIRSVFDGRYRFSRYFALSHFNRPTSLEDLFALNDVELYDLDSDPDELANLASQPGKHADLLFAMNDKLNRRMDDEVGEDSIAGLPFVNERLQFSFRH